MAGLECYSSHMHVLECLMGEGDIVSIGPDLLYYSDSTYCKEQCIYFTMLHFWEQPRGGPGDDSFIVLVLILWVDGLALVWIFSAISLTYSLEL